MNSLPLDRRRGLGWRGAYGAALLVERSQDRLPVVSMDFSVTYSFLLTEQLKFKLENRCSNNQAEQLAFIKVLEIIESQQENHNEQRTAVSYTDSKITLDSIRSAKNHNHLVEEIRKRALTLKKKKWKIEFKWVKAHAGIFGNEIADRLAKEATQNHYVTYSRIPRSAIKRIHGKKA
jgi:ribonuclease HI